MAPSLTWIQTDGLDVTGGVTGHTLVANALLPKLPSSHREPEAQSCPVIERLNTGSIRQIREIADSLRIPASRTPDGRDDLWVLSRNELPRYFRREDMEQATVLVADAPAPCGGVLDARSVRAVKAQRVRDYRVDNVRRG